LGELFVIIRIISINCGASQDWLLEMTNVHQLPQNQSSTNLASGRPVPEKPNELIPDYFTESIGFSNWNALQLSASAASMSMGFLESSLSSNSSSGTIAGRRSLSLLHSGSQGWTSGTGSELSYDDVTEFDRQASTKVKRMFCDIDDALYNSSPPGVSWQRPTSSECTEWRTRFPHLRVVGSHVKNPYNLEDEADLLITLCHHPPPLSRNLFMEPFLEDVSAEEARGLMSPSLSDLNKLQVQGKKIKAKSLPKTGTEGIELNCL
jgi:hypothetical protein